MRGADFLSGSRWMKKLYAVHISQVCSQYGLTQIETDILAFLSNHPGKDTAGDIVRLRMLQKGNVSQAVEALLGKGYLEKSQDEKPWRGRMNMEKDKEFYIQFRKVIAKNKK
mgnify:CR=1 FL=1